MVCNSAVAVNTTSPGAIAGAGAEVDSLKTVLVLVMDANNVLFASNASPPISAGIIPVNGISVRVPSIFTDITFVLL